MKNTLVAVTPTAGTLTWVLPDGVSWQSLEAKTRAEKVFQLLASVLMPAVITEEEVANQIIASVETELQRLQGLQLFYLLAAQQERYGTR